MKPARIAITGIGPISSIGIGKDAFWQGILNAKPNVRKEKCLIDDRLWDEYYAHMVEGFDINCFGLDKNKLDDIAEWKDGAQNTDLNYLIAAIKLAFDDAGLDWHKPDNKIGLVLAHENLSVMPFAYSISDTAYEMLIDKTRNDLHKRDFFDQFYKRFFKIGYDIQVFANVFHVARVFNINSYSVFINNACASGLYALETASQIIKTGQAKAVVAAVSDHPDIYKYIWFRDLGIYAADGIIRPFCKDSKGLVFGDGGAGVVLEDMEQAQKRNATIYAEYLGGGFDLEGWRITVPQIGGDSYRNAIHKALANAKVDPKKIDLLCPHGVGSQPIDYYEAQAITSIFGASPKKPKVTTFKPYFGHNLGGSALLETAALLLSMHHNTIPATLNYDNPDPKFNLSLVKKTIPAKITTALKATCAFAGFNAAAVFRKLPGPRMMRE